MLQCLANVCRMGVDGVVEGGVLWYCIKRTLLDEGTVEALGWQKKLRDFGKFYSMAMAVEIYRYADS